MLNEIVMIRSCGRCSLNGLKVAIEDDDDDWAHDQGTMFLTTSTTAARSRACFSSLSLCFGWGTAGRQPWMVLEHIVRTV